MFLAIKKNILLLPDMMENICNPRAQKTSLSTASAIKQGLAPKQGLQYLEGARLVARMGGGAGRRQKAGELGHGRQVCYSRERGGSVMKSCSLVYTLTSGCLLRRNKKSRQSNEPRWKEQL